MELNITVEIWEKGGRFVARCPELDFVSQGKNPDEAKKHLLEVIEIQFEEMTEMGTLEDYLSECGYERELDTFVPLNKMINSEKHLFRMV